jgi:tyrosinase
MATAHERTERLLSRGFDRNRLPVEPPSRAGTALEPLGPGDATVAPAAPFSVFIRTHEERAIQVVEELMEIANASDLDAVLTRVEQVASETSIEFAQYCLMVFITHHPKGQELPIPPLEERQPEHVKPTGPPKETGELEALGATGSEAALDWYREDTGANFHHERWHVVYPFSGVPNPANPRGPRQLKDRQGELFVYMHEQMLARYDTERICAGMSSVQPLTNYRAPLPEGYDPLLADFSARAANALMTDSTQNMVAELEAWTKALATDTNKANATLSNGGGATVKADANNIGCTIEANIGAVRDPKYGGQDGGLHNNGHVTIGFIPGPGGDDRGGVMLDTSVAIRDPIFYRWHRRIDDTVFAWQEKQTAQSFSDAPNVTLRDVLSGAAAEGKSPDVLVVAADQVTGDAQAFGDAKFGGANWTKDPKESGVVTDVLKTQMKRRTVAGAEVQYLDHEDFWYFIRAENGGAEQTVTVRIFLAAKEFLKDRRRWIEMDRFQQKLKSGKNVIARSSKLSAVIRKPATRPDDPPKPPDRDSYCDCGWPCHLLLPSGGRGAGRDFRILVMLTDWNLDKVEVAGKCGSMSFCGKRDAKYPDRRPMGYPFDRKWPKPIGTTVLEQKNMAARDVKIQLT